MAHSSPAAAPDAPRAPYEGVWRGTIGELPVRACFAEGGSGKFGAYFYMSRLITIPLIKDDKESQLFKEGLPDDTKAPRWTLNRVARDAIYGTWTQGT